MCACARSGGRRNQDAGPSQGGRTPWSRLQHGALPLGPGPAGNSGTAGPQGPQQQGTPRPSKASCPGPLAMGTHSLWDAGQVPPRGGASHKQGATGPGKCGQCSSVTRARNQGPGPGVLAAAPCHVQATSLPHQSEPETQPSTAGLQRFVGGTGHLSLQGTCI